MTESASLVQQSLTQRLHEEGNDLIREVVVLEIAESTQDESKRRGTDAQGVCVIALHQTEGRGRLGRTWHDQRGQSLTMTLGVPSGPVERLAIWAGVAMHQASRWMGVLGAGLRWPNDLVVGGRKLAGALIEIEDGIAHVGIGFNLFATDWPDELRASAVSLAQLGIQLSIVEAASVVCRALDHSDRLTDDELSTRFNAADTLRGSIQTFSCRGESVTGTVIGTDCLNGLLVDSGAGPVRLPAAQTSLVHGPSGGPRPD